MPDRPRRRDVLRLSGVGLASGLAGCSVPILRGDQRGTPQPVVAGGTVLVRGDGHVRGHDAATGEAVDEGRLGSGENWLAVGNPVVVDGRGVVIDPGFEGDLYRLFGT